jgi:hypothetical protein
MALTTTGINPLSAALEAVSVQSGIQARDRNRRLTHEYKVNTALLNNVFSRAAIEVLPAPIDFTQITPTVASV